MDQPNYEYYGMLASTWDLFRGDTSNWSDKFFYREIIRRYGQPVLDVGCGTGRLILDYLQEGLDVDGVDNSPEMLALCRQKAERLGLRPALFQQEMADLDLPRRDRTIIVPSSTFQLLSDPAAAEQGMQRFYRLLEPGGALVMPFSTYWKPGDPIQAEWVQIGEMVRSEDGALIRRWSRFHVSPERQVHDLEEERYEVIVDGQVMSTEHHQRADAFRWYTLEQATDLYAGAGFKNIQRFKEDTFEPAGEGDSGAFFMVLGEKGSE